MKSSPKLRPCLWDGLVVLLVIVLAAVCAIVVWSRSNDAGELTAVVTVDGTEAERIPLKDFPDRERTYSGNGYTLHVCLAASQGENGLGLYVVKTILELHKEKINVTSENGVTSFSFTMQMAHPMHNNGEDDSTHVRRK